MNGNSSLVLTVVVLGFIFILVMVRSFKSRKNRCLVYTALNHDDYFKIVARLKSAGISYAVKTPSNSGYPTPSGYSTSHDYTQYDIYVKKENQHKAQQAIHNGK
ncbi:hypothetical protein [Aneurinibacillus uraniidurans]|uniref:hypothetical protein n=1 Tax=Aneurinibacillus uraniidurans TaxID=2966586 RepID=UPI00234AA06D|nr:hypothetical protein [Aneurinibacillus sp. B1]WCN38635.1 hypothetical protein PO771_04315 [Aneurinibacillus sp. B1]